MKVKYIGPHAAVEVPLDDPVGGYLTVEHGQVVDVPAELANGLLEQGRDSAEENPQHQPQWVKASAKEAAEVDKADAAEGGDQ